MPLNTTALFQPRRSAAKSSTLGAMFKPQGMPSLRDVSGQAGMDGYPSSGTIGYQQRSVDQRQAMTPQTFTPKPLVGVKFRSGVEIPIISNRGIPLDTGTGWVDQLRDNTSAWGKGRVDMSRGAVGMPPLYGPQTAPPVATPRGAATVVSNPAGAPNAVADGSVATPPSQPAYGDLGNSSYLAMNSDWLSQMQKLSAPNDPQNFRQMPMAASGLNQPGSPFQGVNPASVFRNPQLAGEVTPQTYFGMQNAIDRGNQTAATTRQNIGTFEGMGVPNRGLSAAQETADRVLKGLPAQAPLGPVGNLYGNTPLAGAPDVQPRYGQTLQGAQRAYQDTMANATLNTQNRVAEMFGDARLNGQYRMDATGIPNEAGNVQLGTMKSNVKGQSPNTISVRPDGSILVQGALSRERWNDMPSQLPGAEGRTNAQMFAQRREDMAATAAEKKDNRIISRSKMFGLKPQTNSVVFDAMKRQGLPIKGMANGQSQSPGSQSLTQAIKTVSSPNPLVQQVAANAGITKPIHQMDGNDIQALIQSPGANALSGQELQNLQGYIAASMAPGMGLALTPDQQALASSFVNGGPAALRAAIQDQEKKRKAAAAGRQPSVNTLPTGVEMSY